MSRFSRRFSFSYVGVTGQQVTWDSVSSLHDCTCMADDIAQESSDFIPATVFGLFCMLFSTIKRTPRILRTTNRAKTLTALHGFSVEKLATTDQTL